MRIERLEPRVLFHGHGFRADDAVVINDGQMTISQPTTIDSIVGSGQLFINAPLVLTGGLSYQIEFVIGSGGSIDLGDSACLEVDYGTGALPDQTAILFGYINSGAIFSSYANAKAAAGTEAIVFQLYDNNLGQLNNLPMRCDLLGTILQGDDTFAGTVDYADFQALLASGTAVFSDFQADIENFTQVYDPVFVQILNAVFSQ